MLNKDQVELLLVEDNVNDKELILRAFHQNNIEVQIYTVEDGEEALEFLSSSGRYAGRDTTGLRVIFLDLKIPKISGMEVLRKIKSNEKTKHIPVVISTSSQEPADLAQSYELGANSYIVKPIDFESFMAKLGESQKYWLRINTTTN